MVYRLSPSPVLGSAIACGNVATIPERRRMAEYEDQVPESQLGRAEWLADELALCGPRSAAENPIDIANVPAILHDFGLWPSKKAPLYLC
jgi:hypothetical protein